MSSKAKNRQKAFSKSSSVNAGSRVKSSEPPLPFTRAPTNLEPFLSKLNTKHVYITSIDTKPKAFKQKIFAVPLLMNIGLIALLVWRLLHIGPYYLKICQSLMGQRNEMTMDPQNVPWEDLGYEVARRAATFITDLLLYVFVWPWPRDFFGGRLHGNPLAWRLGVRFRDREIVVRRSRKWDQGIGDVVSKNLDGGDEGAQLFGTYVRQAVSPSWMYDRTGYLMMNKEWDLDWKLMIQATKLVDKKTLSLEDFKTTILVHSKDFGWVVESADSSDEKKEEAGRKKIIAFKEELTVLGKENLFFRWIELVQYESSKPGGFGPERQAEAMKKAKELFEAQGVDFEKFWAKVGGMEGMPGMDQM